MDEDNPAERIEHLETLIFTVRHCRVILDADLARVYGVTTKALNQAVKRNSGRFPDDFAFQLSVVEAGSLRSQIAASDPQLAERNRDAQNRSQIVTGSQKHRGPAILPWTFTEHGALMAANILRSEQAVRMSLYVIRAFVRLRDIYRKLLPLLQPPPDPPKRRIGFHAGGE